MYHIGMDYSGIVLNDHLLVMKPEKWNRNMNGKMQYRLKYCEKILCHNFFY
uniref:Uncharacterized protein n=1 Tax=Rhodnius prolixus TaxID=13249 RepID=A0A905R0L4_RHOPR